MIAQAAGITARRYWKLGPANSDSLKMGPGDKRPAGTSRKHANLKPHASQRVPQETKT